MFQKLNHISDESLVNKLKSLQSHENSILAEIVLYLSELDSRRYFRELGYSSLFSYCTQALGYSESAAYRRIQAARMLKTNPEIYEKVKEGKLSLSAIAEIAKVSEEEPKQVLLKQAEGKSKKEVELLAVKYQSPVRPKKETIKPKLTIAPVRDLFSSGQSEHGVTKESFTITIEVDKEFMDLLGEVKELIGHQPTSEIFRKTLKEYSAKRKVIKRQIKPKSEKNTSKEAKHSRSIPKSVKIAVRERDSNQCSFVSPDGKRCCERHVLQFDHVIPYAAG